MGLILFKRIFLLFSLLGINLQATSTPLAPNVQAVVDHYASPEVYNALIAKGEAHAAHFTNPTFVDRFVHAEEHQRIAYHNWYNTPCFSPEKSSLLKPTLQNGDLAFAGIAGTGWGLEYFLFMRIHDFLMQAYSAALRDGSLSEDNFLACKQKQHWAQLICLAAMTTIAGMVFTQTAKRIYFDTWLANDTTTPGMVHAFAGPVKTQVLQAINPQTWFDTCTSLLDYFGCVPDWSKTSTARFGKAFLCNLACIIWYEYSIVHPQWQQYCNNGQLTNTMIKETFSTPEQQQAFVAHGLDISFFSWLQTKCYVTALCNTSISGTLALIGMANAYQKLHPLLKES